MPKSLPDQIWCIWVHVGAPYVLEKCEYMDHPNIWRAMSAIGVADHNIPAQIGSEQQLLGAQGTFFHGIPWFFLHIFSRILYFHGFPWFLWIPWFFMVSHGFHGKSLYMHIPKQTAFAQYLILASGNTTFAPLPPNSSVTGVRFSLAFAITA